MFFRAGKLNDIFGKDVVPSTVPQVSVSDAASDNKATILDVRARSEFAEGHLPRAVNIPLAELQKRIAEIPAGDVVVHCQGGARSAMAASILQRSGRTDVANMGGGFSEWQREGHDVVRGKNAG